MAVAVTIAINSKTLKTIEIRRVTNTGPGELDPDVVSEYVVTEHLRGGWTRYGGNVTHRYGDPVEYLIEKALEGLRG